MVWGDVVWYIQLLMVEVDTVLSTEVEGNSGITRLPLKTLCPLTQLLLYNFQPLFTLSFVDQAGTITGGTQSFNPRE